MNDLNWGFLADLWSRWHHAPFLPGSIFCCLFTLLFVPPILQNGASVDRYVIQNETQSRPVSSCVHIADSFLPRLIGLLGRTGLSADEGLLIRPSSGVHTFGMRFPIDVVALDRSMRVTGTWAAVAPWRVCALSLKTSSVLELAAGRIQMTSLQVGDQLSCGPWTDV